MTKVLLADDHTVVRKGLKEIIALVTSFEVAAEAWDAKSVMEQLALQPFDLVLIDLNMPGCHGTDLVRWIRAHYPKMPILVLSMHDKPQVVAQVLKAGANGYVTKGCEPSVLAEAMRTVRAFGSFVEPSVAVRMAFEKSSADTGPALADLSEREMSVLRLLTQGKSVKEIGDQLAISPSTVSTHKARLMEKLTITSNADLLRFAIDNDLQ